MTASVRHIFIGDVHGCLSELELLLKKLAVTRDDQVLLVGDLVAKGPDSQGVVACARERGLRGVRGNHDEAVLRYRRALQLGEAPPALKKGHLTVAEALTEADFRYLEQMPLWLALSALNVLVVHAGVVPGLALAQQKPDDLLNMRTLRDDGSPSSKLDEGRLWASVYGGPMHIVFGHDATTGLQRHPHATGLDTGCVYGGELTALVLPERKFVAVRARRTYLEYG